MAKLRNSPLDKDLFRIPILDFVAHNHPLILLAEKVNWNSLKQHFDDLYKTGVGQPLLEVRLVLGLHMLKYLDDLSDEDVVTKYYEDLAEFRNSVSEFFRGIRKHWDEMETLLTDNFHIMQD